MAVVAGAVLSLLLLVKVVDFGFFTAFDRPVDLIYDWGYAGIGIETLRDAVGTARANLAVAVMVVAGAALLVLPVLALLRVTRVAAGHRAGTLCAIAALGVVWARPPRRRRAGRVHERDRFVVREVRGVEISLQDHDVLAREIARDRFRASPGDRLLTSLRGKDVLLLFVESYGRVAVQGSSVSAGIGAVLDRGSAELQAAGFSSRSAFLTSPTFGGISWLAHSTLQTGVWIDSRRRYDQLVRSDRLTLSRAFKRAGWRTVAAMPQNKRTWREGSAFYHFDKVYDRRNVGYRGPGFGLPSMPDQYALLALQRRELGRRDRPPLFAEVALISSHAPWTRIPELLPWEDVGDGSIFARLPAQEPTEDDDDQARAYGRSIEYTLRTIVSFVRHYGDDELVAIVVGDHQPATSITGHGASHDVPISIIARDPKVLERIAAWGWEDGLRPDPDAPVWRMDAFRDRFLGAFGSSPGAADSRGDEPTRAAFDAALLRARMSAYAPGEFVGQESFMTAGEIRALALRAGIGPGVAVLDACCGLGGPGRLVARELGCAYLGVDADPGAVAIARRRAGDLPCRYAVAHLPPLPAGPFDVVLLLETMLAFADKDALVRGVAAALGPGGRFAFTLEEGPPLTAAERAAMPDADTVCLIPLGELIAWLEGAGLAVVWQEDHTRAHRATAQALAGAFAADAEAIAARIGPPRAGRAAHRPSAVDRVAGRGARAEARAGGGAAGRPNGPHDHGDRPGAEPVQSAAQPRPEGGPCRRWVDPAPRRGARGGRRRATASSAAIGISAASTYNAAS